MSESLPILVLCAAIAIAVAIAVRALLIPGPRADDAIALLTRITDALVLDPSLGRLPVTVTARSSLWRWSAVTIEVGGRVPSRALREAALQLVNREAQGLVRAHCRVEDRIAVAEPPGGA